MRYLITGGCGFIGSALANALVTTNEVDVIDVKEPVKPIDVVHYMTPNIWQTPSNYDVVFHLGAVSSIRTSFLEPVKTAHSNILGTIDWLETFKHKKTKIVFGSSCTVYCKEHSPYSLSKKVCEEYCEMYKKLYNSNISIARIGNVFGGDDPKGVIYRLLTNRSKNEPLKLTGDGSQTRDFIHVHDVVDGLITISKVELPYTFDLCTGILHSLNQIADLIGGEKEYVDLPPGEGFKAELKTPNIPNWSPTISIEDYIVAAKEMLGCY